MTQRLRLPARPRLQRRRDGRRRGPDPPDSGFAHGSMDLRCPQARVRSPGRPGEPPSATAQDQRLCTRTPGPSRRSVIANLRAGAQNHGGRGATAASGRTTCDGHRSTAVMLSARPAGRHRRRIGGSGPEGSGGPEHVADVARRWLRYRDRAPYRRRDQGQPRRPEVPCTRYPRDGSRAERRVNDFGPDLSPVRLHNHRDRVPGVTSSLHRGCRKRDSGVPYRRVGGARRARIARTAHPSPGGSSAQNADTRDRQICVLGRHWSRL